MLDHVRTEIQEEDFRRWFGATAYASDSGDQITVWVPNEPIRRLMESFHDTINRGLAAIDRSDTYVRFVVAGLGDEDDEDV